MRTKGIIWAAILFAFLANATFAEPVCSTGFSLSSSNPQSASPQSPQAQAAVQQMMAGPSVFIENQGQWADTDIKFALDSRGMNVGLTDKGPRFQLFKREPSQHPNNPRSAMNPAREDARPPQTGGTASPPSESSTRSTPQTGGTASSPSESAIPPNPETRNPNPGSMHEFRLVFDGAANVTPVGRGKSERTFNYLKGDPSTHREGVGSFETVWYENLYPGISLELSGQMTGLKYNFHVAPGADYRAIRLRYEGIEGLSVKPNGTLEIQIKDGWQPLTDGAPYIYQEVNGEKKPVAGEFTPIDDFTCGFQLSGKYDRGLPLLIDPYVAWGSFLGGAAADYGEGIAVDSSRNVYVTGYTVSTGWVSGGINTTYLGGNYDAFIVKLSMTGAHVWSTYLGGSGEDRGYGIAADFSGNIYVTGYTNSTGWISAGWDTSHNGGWDGFIVALSTDGSHRWSTYLGGSASDQGFGVVVDSDANVCATGGSSSPGWVSGGWDTTHNGGQDIYIVKLTSGANSCGPHTSEEARQTGATPSQLIFREMYM